MIYVFLTIACRIVLAKQEARKLRQIRAAVILQKNIRAYNDRAHFLKVREATIVLQNGKKQVIIHTIAIRGVKSRKQFSELKIQSAVVSLQTAIRAKNAKDYFKKMRKAVILAQTRWRGKLAKRELTALRIEARSLSKGLV